VKLGAALWDPAGGWDARLWRRWALYTALAHTIILATVLLLAGLGLGLDATRLAVDHRTLGTLVIATTGALTYGCVLGALQWRVLRERLPMARRQWVLAASFRR
jgi:hypothetical protein